MNLGFSLYFSTGVEKNCELIERFSNAGFTQAFTSLHIPEESNSNYSPVYKALSSAGTGGAELEPGTSTINKTLTVTFEFK